MGSYMDRYIVEIAKCSDPEKSLQNFRDYPIL